MRRRRPVAPVQQPLTRAKALTVRHVWAFIGSPSRSRVALATYGIRRTGFLDGGPSPAPHGRVSDLTPPRIVLVRSLRELLLQFREELTYIDRRLAPRIRELVDVIDETDSATRRATETGQ